MKLPPTFPDLDCADEDTPIIDGVIILSSANRGVSNEWEFKIDINKKKLAINNLFKALDLYSSFTLADHSRGDYESCASYSKNENKYLIKFGGHGWSANDLELQKLDAIVTARKRVKYNLGVSTGETGKLCKFK